MGAAIKSVGNLQEGGSSQLYYPAAVRRVQITPKTSTNITRYLYSRIDRFSHNAQATNWIELTKKTIWRSINIYIY